MGGVLSIILVDLKGLISDQGVARKLIESLSLRFQRDLTGFFGRGVQTAFDLLDPEPKLGLA